jgi:hypothetical protein
MRRLAAVATATSHADARSAAAGHTSPLLSPLLEKFRYLLDKEVLPRLGPSDLANFARAGHGCRAAVAENRMMRWANANLGRAAQVDPIKPAMKAPVFKRFKPKCEELLSNFAFKFNLRR